MSMEEAFKALNKKPTKKLVEAVESTPIIPAPYDKYFEVIDPNEIEFEDGMIEIGEEVDGATVLAYLAAKDEYLEYFDSDAFLINDEACPVVEIAHDRCYPIDVEEIFADVDESLNESNNPDKHLEGTYFEIDDYDNITSEDLANYAASPTVRKYAQKATFDKIATSDAILEMTAADFGDGHGDPKGYIFAKDGKVGYIELSPNAYSYVPSISYQDFKDIIEGKALLWYEIGFGDFSGADHYIGEPVTSVEEVIKECDEESYVNLENLWNL